LILLCTVFFFAPNGGVRHDRRADLGRTADTVFMRSRRARGRTVNSAANINIVVVVVVVVRFALAICVRRVVQMAVDGVLFLRVRTNGASSSRLSGERRNGRTAAAAGTS